MQSIEQEIRPCFKDNVLDLELLLKTTPYLDAAFQETLRLHSASFSARHVEAPVVIGGKMLTKGGKILMPNRHLHLDESVFGPDTASFNVNRFLSNKDLSRNSSFKPFGGGNTLCSGRFLAKQEVFAFVAFVLHRYDLKLQNPKQDFPKCDESKPTLGIMDPVGKDPLYMLVSPKPE